MNDTPKFVRKVEQTGPNSYLITETVEGLDPLTPEEIEKLEAWLEAFLAWLEAKGDR